MARTLAVPALLIAVFVGVFLSVQGMQSNGPASASQQQAVTEADSTAAGLEFNQVVPVLQAYFDQNQTYVGATLPAGSGVVLASADATSYCLQDGNAHEVGPNGTPQSGLC